MGYRDDMVVRLREVGVWDQLTGDQQERFLQLTDDQARQMLVMDDHWEMGEQQAIEVFGVMSLVKMIGGFGGALVQQGVENAGKLSKAGKLLAEFLLELKQRGMTPDEMDQHLRDLNPLVIAAVLAAYEGGAQ